MASEPCPHSFGLEGFSEAFEDLGFTVLGSQGQGLAISCSVFVSRTLLIPTGLVLGELFTPSSK